MGFFDKFLDKTKEFDNTTKGLFLGAPEAEAESLNQSAMLLHEVFIQDSNIFEDLAHEKFIITGRKGSGKSAIANYIMLSAKSESNVFVDFVKQTEVSLQKAVQIGAENSQNIDMAILFQWIILYKIISLFTQNERLSSQRYCEYLKRFVSDNDDFSIFDQYKITDFVSQRNCEIDISALKIFGKIKGIDSLQTIRKKMPFYEMIPHLKNVVKTLGWTINQYKDETEYFIFFDDLDNDFKSNNDSCKDNLLSLIRLTKDFNALFSEFEFVKIKVILLLRDDIKNYLLANADVAKVFASYSTGICWFSDELYRKKPNDLLIKKFIDKRIRYGIKQLNNENLSYINNWEDFVKVPFKDVLDFTFYTPRDLLLFFKPITENSYPIPLLQDSINDLFNKYCDAIIDEIKSLLSIYFTLKEINCILSILERELLNSDADSEYLSKLLSEKIHDESTLEILLNASVIGWRKEGSGYVYFKHREKTGEDISIETPEDYRITLHRAVKNYFIRHKNRPR